MMQAENFRYSNTKGLAAEHTIEGVLDEAAFGNSWRENKQLKIYQKIANKHLSINELQQHPELINALLEAHRQGMKTLYAKKYLSGQHQLQISCNIIRLPPYI
ncbi:MAG: hypothetical protein ACN4GR_02920 [Arenicellales bacterium]